MSIQYSIVPSELQVRVAGEGRVTMPEMIGVVDRIACDPRFRSEFTVIFDIREADYTAEIEDGNEFVAALDRRESAFQKRFALVVSESLQPLATLFCLLAHAKGIHRIKSFTGVQEACDWVRESGS